MDAWGCYEQVDKAIVESGLFMSVKPLSGDDLSYQIMSDKSGQIRDTTHAHIKFQRLRELFADLVDPSNLYETRGGNNCVTLKRIKELFGPLVPK